MTTDSHIEEALRRMRCTTTPAQDKRILGDALAMLIEESKTGATNETLKHHPDRRSTPQNQVDAPSFRKRSHIKRRLLVSAGIATLVLVGVWQWFWWPSDSWAQVVEATRDKPWIHMSGKTPDGQTMESWFSLSREVSASRHGENISFKDHRLRIAYQYHPNERVLYRTPDSSGSSRENFLWFGKLFR